MSIGNTKTSGNKGNNFPYQLAVLELLGQIAAGGGGGGCPCPSSAQEATLLDVLAALSSIAPVSVTPTLVRTSAIGSVAAGARSVSVYNSGGANGTVLGSIIKPGESLSWSAGAVNNTLGIIAYDGTGTELVITTTV